MSLVLAAALAFAAQAPANAPPRRAGECRWVHGRFAVYNGSGVRRIRVIGTRRIIALYDDEDIPPAIERYQEDAADHNGPSDGLFGDFYVCAREHSRPGWMQHVRLRRTRNPIYRGRSYRSR